MTHIRSTFFTNRCRRCGVLWEITDHLKCTSLSHVGWIDTAIPHMEKILDLKQQQINELESSILAVVEGKCSDDSYEQAAKNVFNILKEALKTKENLELAFQLSGLKTKSASQD